MTITVAIASAPAPPYSSGMSAARAQLQVGAWVAAERDPHRADRHRAAHVDEQARPGLQVPELRRGVPGAVPGPGRVAAERQRGVLRVVAVAGPPGPERRHPG